MIWIATGKNGEVRTKNLREQPRNTCYYPDHCVSSIEKKKVIWIVTGKNGEVRTKNLREQPRNTCYYPHATIQITVLVL